MMDKYKRNRKNRSYISIRRRFFVLLLVVVLVFNLMPASMLEDVFKINVQKVHAANKDNFAGITFNDEEARVQNELKDAETGEIKISGSKDMEDYSKAYFSYPSDHWTDTLNIALVSELTSEEIDEFIALGNSTYPFKGIIKLTTGAGTDNTFRIPEAFFDYVADSAQIVDGLGNPTPLILQRIDENTGEPVFARHVKHDADYTGDVRTLQVQIDPLNGEYNYNSSGFIGEMDVDASIKLDIYDNTTMIIKSKGCDVGYVCGKMNSGSKLTVNSITSTNASYSVESTEGGGNAGGVVGSICPGAELVLKCNMPNTAAQVKAMGSGSYAGGITGYNDGGVITLDGFTTSNKYIVKNTLIGVSGAGGIAGFFRPVFDTNGEYEFDVSCYSIGTDVDNRMAANGTGSVGGLFGVLINEIENESTYSSGDITIKDLSDNASTLFVVHSDTNVMDNYGGLIGEYTACDLVSSLWIKDISLDVDRTDGSYTNYGGGVGLLEGGQGNDENAVYVKFDDFVATTKGNTISGSYYGGIIGTSNNSFIDAKNVNITSSDSFCGGGIIGNMEDGILRLIDTTTLSGGISAPADGKQYYTGQIVGHRDNSIVFGEYYVDSENSANSRQWKFNRGTNVRIDDIGSWGEVLRFTDMSASASTTTEKYGDTSVLTINEETHQVEVSVPTVQTTISSVADFAMLSLCFQINASENPYLSFNSGWNYTYDTINNQNLTLGATFSLAGTGLLGLTRDNLSDAEADTTYCVYSGSFDGGNKTLTLAIGEPYGYRSSSLLSSHSAEGNGKIYRHQINGLFGIYDWADTSTNESTAYSVKDITFSGTVDISSLATIKSGSGAADLTAYCGSFAGEALNDFSATNVTTDNIVFTHSGTKPIEMGRLLGEAASTINSITVSGSSFKGVIQDDKNGSTFNGNTNSNTSLGGVIGQISHNSDESETWSFSDISLEGSIKNETSSTNGHRLGGLVADVIGSYKNNSYHRFLELNDIDIKGLTINGNSSNSLGGLLGYSWNKTDVKAISVTVENLDSSHKATVSNGTASGAVAGLVYRATGHWEVTSIDIQNIVVSANKAGSVGVIVNKGISYHSKDDDFYSADGRSAIYLELKSVSAYSLVMDSSSSIGSGVFDELCAYTAPSADYIMKNGNGIVSIHSGLYTDGSTSSGTYHAQTSYGAKANPNSRYYYNLDTVTKQDTVYSGLTSTEKNNLAPQIKLMSWGLDRYACTNLKQYFADAFNGIIANATYDMNGYSWYPINVDSNITVNGTFVFNNQGFEGSEKAKFNGESSNAFYRTSLYHTGDSSKTQHYLMHNGLFHDVNASTVTIGTNGVILEGTIAGYAEPVENTSTYESTVCGALICGTMFGSDSSHVAAINTSNSGSVKLNGIRVYNVNAASDYALNVSDYAPLLVNKASKFANLNVSRVSVNNTGTSSNPTSWYSTNSITGSGNAAATSLIGKAGTSTSSEGINVTFTEIKLDGRNRASALTTYKAAYSAYDTALTKAYCTSESIFSKATLLHQFQFAKDSGSRGTYDYEIGKDWNTTNGAAIHNVTYGKEVGYTSSDTTTQYYDLERKYVGQADFFTSPVTHTDADGTDADLFKIYFRPYVYVAYNSATFDTDLYNQLEVNHTASTDIEGCGTYDDPYKIASANDLLYIQRAMGSNHTAGYKFYIPSAITSTSTINNTRWCGENTHTQYIYVNNVGYCPITVGSPNGDTSNVLGGSQDNSEEIVRRYLAGAYYKVTNNITILYAGSNGFEGLGHTKNVAGKYDDAVFHGVIDGNNRTITNQSRYPLIYASSGCVVKNLTVISEVDGTATSNRKTLPDNTSGQGKSFNGYDSEIAYGILIGRVLGGDNIIDKVTVSFSSGTIDISGKKSQLIPIGGYVGVVVDGGVIFRNMNIVAAASKDKRIFDNISFSATNGNASNAVDTEPLKEDNTEWLYINPIIGRVINGYAVTESDEYRPYEDGTRTYKGGGKPYDVEYWASWTGGEVKHIGAVDSDTYNETDYTLEPVTMRNGNKNYSIADIDSTPANKLKVSSSRAITIPDSQAFFLMSIMVNSGMGLQGDASTGADASVGGYYQPGKYYTVRHSTYDRIGDDALTNSDLVYTDSLNDIYANTQLPYFIMKYTNATDGKYYAKILSNGSNTSTVTLGSYNETTEKYDPVNYYLPDGYKGIGNIYSNDAGLQLYITNFTGSDSKISLNSSLNYYWNANTGAYDSKYNLRDQSGFGLFNYQPGKTNNQTTSRYYGFTITGNVEGECIDSNSSEGKHIPYVGDNKTFESDSQNNSIDNTKMISVGGLIGTSGDEQFIDSVALNNMFIHGIKHSGGLIGRVAASKSTAIKTTIRNSASKASDKITVRGAGNTGGMVGRSFNGKIDIDNGNASYNITEVVCECTNRTGYDYNYGVGGFIGNIRTSSTGNDDIATIKNVTVGLTTMTKATSVKCEGATVNAGGLIGIVNKPKLTVENCYIYNQNVISQYNCGGLIGYFASTGKASTIKNTVIASNKTANAEIKSTTASSEVCAAGGFIGACKRDLYPLTIDKSHIELYKIEGVTYAGGIIGIWGHDKDSGTVNTKAILTNLKIDDCSVTATTSGYAGGLVGFLNSPSNNEKYLYGYNILENKVVLSGDTQGTVVGWLSNTTYNIVKIVGFSRQGNISTEKTTGKATTKNKDGADKTATLPYGTNGYVIFADYAGASLNDDYSSTFSTVNNSYTESGKTYKNINYDNTSTSLTYRKYVNYSPFVTSTDQQLIDDTLFFTGDGVGYGGSIAYSNSRIGNILTATGGNTNKRYKYAYDRIGSMKTSDMVTKLDSYGKYSSYKTEMDGIAAARPDFPVLVLDDASALSNTEFINNYLRYLTNTDFNFAKQSYYGSSTASDANAVFKVKLGSYRWVDNNFVYTDGTWSSSNTNGAYLSNNVNTGTFSLVKDKYDNQSDTDRFTLIDVEFFDPSDTTHTQIAYHLYVPVLVKKMLHYDFEASFLSGTNYRISPYEGSKRYNTVIENTGNPVTLEVRWTYKRSLTEWQSVLESGESFLITLDKKLKVKDYGEGLPDGVQLVLVDPQNNNKHYYANETDNSGLYTVGSGEHELDLSKFEDTNGEEFTPVDFNDFFVVTSSPAEENTSTKFTRLAAGTSKADAITDGATIFDGMYYYKPDNAGTYQISLAYKTGVADSSGNIKEDYYISFFTDETDTSVYHLEVSDRGSHGNASYPTKVAKNNATHLLTGDIFVNNFSIERVYSFTGEKKMTLAADEYNDTLSGVLKAEIGIKPDHRINMQQYLGRSSVEVYHSFIVMLNRQDTSSERGILTTPVVNVTNYNITHTINSTGEVVLDRVINTETEMTNVYELINSNYIELRSNVDLKTYLRNSCSATTYDTIEVNATVSLGYNDDTKLKTQFPTRDIEHLSDESIGTVFGAGSGISANPAAAAFNKTLEEEWNDVPYYCTLNTNAELVLNSDDALNELGEYYQLGINELDLNPDELTEYGYAPEKLNAVYNVSNLSDAGNAHSMKLTVTLRKKDDYDTTINIADYIDDLNLYYWDSTAGENHTGAYVPFSDNTETITADELQYNKITSNETNAREYTYIVTNPYSVLDYDEDSKRYQIPITFAVKSGDSFTGQYSNYMIRLDVALYTDYTASSDATKVDGSYDNDHVIWTNAKIIPRIVGPE